MCVAAYSKAVDLQNSGPVQIFEKQQLYFCGKINGGSPRRDSNPRFKFSRPARFPLRHVGELSKVPGYWPQTESPWNSFMDPFLFLSFNRSNLEIVSV